VPLGFFIKGAFEMNEQAITYWNELKHRHHISEQAFVRAYRFAETPNELAQLVIDGIKTASSNTNHFFEQPNRHMPQIGDYNIILNKEFRPVCCIQITAVKTCMYEEVDEAFAIAEGDGSYENWDAIHTDYFSEQLAAANLVFHRQTLLLCQSFQLIDSKN
jgi:uncharacterized protein YhfF